VTRHLLQKRIRQERSASRVDKCLLVRYRASAFIPFPAQAGILAKRVVGRGQATTERTGRSGTIYAAESARGEAVSQRRLGMGAQMALVTWARRSFG